MNWLIYLAEANAYLVIFYLVYSLLLAKDTHYQLSRAYLLLSSLVAFVLPLVQLNFLKPTIYVYAAQSYELEPTQTPIWQNMLFYGYLTGVCVVLALFILKLIQIKRLTQSNTRINKTDHHIIRLDESNTGFSFFNYLFIGSDVADEPLIIRHELVHIRQKHSADVVFTELLKAVNWFNPVVYLLQDSIRTVHEYIADEQTAQSTDNTIAYASFLIDNAYGQGGPAITHSFFNHNLLKKRIIMLDQKRSGNLARLKYLVAVPLCAALLTESTLGFSKSYGIIGIGTQEVKVDTAKKTGVKDARQVPPPPPLQKRPGKRLPPPPPAPPVKSGEQVVKIDPRAPRPDISKVKFPPPVVTKDVSPKSPRKASDQVKFPPPVVKKDISPKSPRKASDQVKFPRPPRTLPPPPPPAPPVKSGEPELRIETRDPQPVKSDNQITKVETRAPRQIRSEGQVIRVETRSPRTIKSDKTDIRIDEPVKQQ